MHEVILHTLPKENKFWILHLLLALTLVATKIYFIKVEIVGYIDSMLPTLTQSLFWKMSLRNMKSRYGFRKVKYLFTILSHW